MRRRIPWLATVYALLTLAGCANTGMFKLSKGEFPKTSPKNPVVRILGLWEPTDGMFDNKSCRGFSAQILFFGQNSDLPAQVDGDVRIYVFDDQGTDEDRAMPIREFEYPAATWNAFLSKGPLGATYSVFVPYTRPGVHEAKCALRIRYIPKTGFPAYSDMVNVVMPGVKSKKAKEETVPIMAPFDGTADAATTARHETAAGRVPRARGISSTLPTAQEIQDQLHARRPRAVELNSEERRRILRDAAAKLEPDGEPAIALAGYDDSESVPAAREKNQVPRSSRDLQSDQDDEDFFNARSTVEPSAPDSRPKNPESGGEPNEDS